MIFGQFYGIINSMEKITETQKTPDSQAPNKVIDHSRLKEVFGNDIEEARALYGWMKEVKAGTATVVLEKDGSGVSIYDRDGDWVYFNSKPEALDLLEQFYEDYSDRFTESESRMDH